MLTVPKTMRGAIVKEDGEVKAAKNAVDKVKKVNAKSEEK
jgi:hypothetical protein